MDCRAGCGGCCIAPSISSALPGMPEGKPAGVRCVNLDQDYLCRLWNTAEYPAVCRGFQAERLTCGQSRDDALVLLTIMEHLTRSTESTI